MKKLLFLIFLLIVSLLGACQNESEVKETMITGISLEKITQFFVGETENKQSLVHAFIPTDANETPVIMLPGLGLGASIYESTPDGRNGWAYDFLEAGYQVYTIDTSDLVTAGFTEEETGYSLSKWDSQSIWRRWGLGEGPNQPYDEGQFPVESFVQFYASIPMQVKEVPKNDSTSNADGGKNAGKSEEDDVNSTNRSGKLNTPQSQNTQSTSSRANQQEVDNLIKLLEEVGPSVLLVHSMGGEIGYEVTRQRPELVKAIVAIEPVGSPTDEEEVKNVFSSIPYLGIYGDYIDSRNQTGRLESVKTTSQLIKDNGGISEVIELTKKGLYGNSHLMMIDKNNDQISDMIIKWLGENI